MHKILIFIIFVSSNSYGRILTPKKSFQPIQQKNEDLLVKSFYDDLLNLTKKLDLDLEVKKTKISVNDGKRGALIIERMKEANRKKLAKLRGQDPDKVKSGADLVKLQKEENKNLIKKIREAQKSKESEMTEAQWKKSAKEELERIRKKVISEHNKWKSKYKKELQEWSKSKKDYQKQTDQYARSLSDIPLVLPVSKKDLDKNLEKVIKKEAYFVSGSLVNDIRDQKYRPTCSAFAGIKQIETLLIQSGKQMNLSEQYFYWASKPKCQSSPCSNRGSWVGNGLKYSQNLKKLDISLERDCPYNTSSIANNETQLPLAKSCFQGAVRVKNFKYIKTLDEVMDSLDKQQVVFASIKLTENFYTTKGFVLERENNQKKVNDMHADGHAVPIIGYMKLPMALNEGKVCFMIANSWGTGWGKGGHGCLSEKWLLAHRSTNPFVIIESIEVK